VTVGALTTSGSIGALTIRTQGTWHPAVQLPGTASSSPYAASGVLAVACATKAWCAAGGSNSTTTNKSTPVVSTYSASSWHHVVSIPGFSSIAPSGFGSVSKIVCTSSSNCEVLGQYHDQHDYTQIFSARLAAGTWQKAKALSNFAAINQGSGAVDTLSCPTATYCVAGGVAQRAGGPAWYATSNGGTWGKVQFVATIAGVTGHAAQVEVSSCPSVGNCTIGGYTTSPHGWTDQRAFTSFETNGAWHAPVALSTANLAKGPFTPRSITSISCRANGSCTVVGYGSYGIGVPTAFSEDEVAGRWHLPQVIPGLATIDAGQPSSLVALACISAGNCSAGGYFGISPSVHAFTTNEVGGLWQSAHAVVGFDKLATIIRSISCVTAGSCVAVGSYFPVLMESAPEDVFVMTSLQRVWGPARALPNYTTLNVNTLGSGSSPAVACSTAGTCVVGGSYQDTSQRHHGFVEAGTGIH
jgi:hypothetical protein